MVGEPEIKTEPESLPEISDESNRDSLSSLPVGTWVVLGLVFLVLLLLLPLRQNESYMCIKCGRQRKDVNFLRFSLSSSETETPTEEWYRQNMEPEHDHLWVRNYQLTRSGLFGFPTIRVETALTESPLADLDDETLLEMYQKVEEPEVLRNSLERLARWPRNERERQELKLINHQVRKWLDSGLDGDWKQLR